MARSERWYSTFTSLRGHTYTVSIQQENYYGSSTMLILGDEPFTTDEENSDDFFKPVRKQSGYINVCCSPTVAAELLPDTNTQNYVELKRDGAIVWVGFMKNESYNQNPFGQEQIFQFPLLCPLSILENAEIDSNTQNNGGIFSIGALLKKILDTCGVSFDNVIVSKDVNGIKQMDAIVSFWNWLESNDDYNYRNPISYDNLLFKCKVSLDKLLEQICEFFGWTCHIVGKDVFFDVIDSSVSDRVKIPYSQLGYETRSWQTAASRPSLYASSLSFVSDENKESYVQGVSSILLKCDVNEYGANLFNLPKDDVELEIGDLINVTTFTPETGKNMYLYESLLVFRKTHSSGLFNQNEDFYFKNCHFTNTRIGSNLFSDIDLIHISSSQIGRFSPSLSVKLQTRTSSLYSGVNMSFISNEEYILPRGYFSINGSAECYGDKFAEYKKAVTIPAVIKWGNLSIDTSIRLDKNGKFASNVSYTTQMNNPSIPAGQWHDLGVVGTGKISITLNPVVSTVSDYPLYIFIKELNVSFGNLVALNHHKRKNEYRSRIANSATGNKEIDLALCTDNENVSGRASLVDKNYTYITSFNYNGALIRPENRLLSRMQKQLATRTKQLFIDVVDDSETTQYPIINTNDGAMAVLSVSRHYRDDKITLQLQQIH